MNTKKILLSVLICLVMVATLCLSVACNREVKLDMMDATKWEAGAEGEVGSDIYVPSNDKDGNLVINFNEKPEWSCTAMLLAHFTEADLAKVSTLVVTAKMTTNAPFPALMFKGEGIATDADGNKVRDPEVKVKGTADYTIYEWDLNGYDITKITRLIIFADPGVNSSSGTITIKEMYLTSNELNTTNDAKNKPADEAGPAPVPTAADWNEVTADNLAIGHWMSGTALPVYDITENNGTYDVEATKGIATDWTAIVSYVHGNALATMKTLKLTVQGDAGKEILVKPFDNTPLQKTIILTGAAQEVNIRLKKYPSEEGRDFSKDNITADNKVVIMGLPGKYEGTVGFKIISAEFSTEDYIDPNWNEIANNATTITKWQAESAYTNVNVEDDAITATIGKNDGWAQIKADVFGIDMSSYDLINVTLSGVNGVPFVVKTWDGTQYCYDGRDIGGVIQAIPDTDDVTVKVAVPAGDYSEEAQTLIVFVNVGDQRVNKNCTVTVSAEFARTANEITATNKKITKWYSPWEVGVTQFVSNADGSVVVSQGAADWRWIKADVTGAELVNMKTFRMTIKGIKGESISVKPFDKNELEYKLELAAEDEYTIIIDLTKATNVDLNNAFIFMGYKIPADASEASFTIVSAEFSTEEAPAAE